MESISETNAQQDLQAVPQSASGVVIPFNSLPLEGRVCDVELLTWVISTRKIWKVRLLPLGRAEGAICRPKVGCRLLPLSEREMVLLAAQTGK